MADTHKQRVLDLLSDGTPHSHREGYRLGVMLHSRVADLRRDGYGVECWREGDVYWYRLVTASADFQRFMQYVEKRADGCWQWTGTTTGSGEGYGAFWISTADKSGQVRAHRWIYEQLVGSIPEGLQLDHLCRNKHCVNPEHLEPVTASENKRRDYEALGTCRSGRHIRNEETTFATKEGWRICRLCFEETQRRSREKKARLLNEPDGREVGPRRSGSLSGQPASPLAASFPAPGDGDGNGLAAQQIDGQLTLTGSEFRRSAA